MEIVYSIVAALFLISVVVFYIWGFITLLLLATWTLFITIPITLLVILLLIDNIFDIV